jgi:hypothetical protein
MHTASQLDVPAAITPEQLEMLLNNLLQNDEKLPYSFYIEEQVCKVLNLRRRVVYSYIAFGNVLKDKPL